MIYPSNVIQSAFTPKTPLQQFQGTGKIILDKDNVYLQSGSDRFVLDTSLKHFFRNGESVHYSINQNTIYLTPTKENDSFHQPSPSDMVSFHQREDLSPAIASPNGSLYISVPSTVPAGYYLFFDVETTLRFLNQSDNVELSQYLEELYNNSGVIVIKVEHTASATSGISIIVPEDLPGMLGSLIDSFSSEVFRSLSVDLLLDILQKNGMLSTDFLNLIDAEIIAGRWSSVNLRTDFNEIQQQYLAQWIKTVLVAGNVPDIDTSLLPFNTIQTVPETLESVISNTELFMNTPPLNLNKLILTDASLSEHPYNAIEFAMESMGYTFEHILLNEYSATNSGNALPVSIKSLLMQILARSSDTIPPSPTVTNDNNHSLPKIPSAQPPSLKYTVSTDTMKIQDTYDLLLSLRQSLVSFIRDCLPQIIPAQSVNTQSVTLIHASSTGSTPPDVSPINTRSLLAEVVKTLRSVIPVLKNSILSNIAVKESIDPSSARQSPANDALIKMSQITDHLEQLLLNHSPDEILLAKLPSLSINHASGIIFPHDLSRFFHTLLDSVETIIASASDTHGHVDIQNTTSSASLPEKSTADPGLTIPSNQLEGIPDTVTPQTTVSLTFSPQTLAAALDTLESLQLLARPVITTEGIQQIIALPIKFDDRIIELSLRLLKYQGKKKTQKRQTHFSVFIDVSPPSLGRIHSHLDYYRSKKLTITIEFERKSSLNWFEQQKDAFHDALQPLFNNTVLIDFKLMSRKKDQPPSTLSSNSIIDLKV